MADKFWELYKHPKWQAMRLRIMERAGFKCEWCDYGDKTLHVHHTYYEKNAAPWEYPEGSLLCLCEGCHAEAEGVNAHLKRLLGLIASRHGKELGLMQLEGYMEAMVADQGVNENPQSGYFDGIGSGPDCQGVADYFGLGFGDVDDSRDDGGLDVHTLRRLSNERNYFGSSIPRYRPKANPNG